MDEKDLADLEFKYDLKLNKKLEKILSESDLLEKMDEKKLEDYF